MDYLIRGKFLFTQQSSYGADGIISDGAVYVSGSEIVEIGRFRDLKSVYPTASIVGSPRFWVMPGLVNAHQHGKGLTQFQLGGLDEPLEISRVRTTPTAKAPAYLDALYGALRMIEAGVTCCLHYNSSRSAAQYRQDVEERMRAYQDAGMRVSFALDIRNRNHFVYGDNEFFASLPSPLKEQTRERYSIARTVGPEEYFAIVQQLDGTMRDGSHDRLKLFLAPAGPQWCSEDLLRALHREADTRNLGMQIHLLETKYQRAYFQRTCGKSAVQWLDDLEFLTPQLSLAHGVWVSRDDIGLIARRGSAVVHNPSSNLRLKSGIAPVTLLHEAKVPLALGLDSSTINDDSDMFQEMRLCANLQRMPGIGKQPIAAKAIFDMATRGGAHALGWDNSCGTLEPGKRADLILLDARRLMQPYLSSNHHPIDTLLYRAKASDVDTVMIDGEILYRGKKHQRPAARRAARELAGLVQPPGTTAADPLEAALFPHVLSYYQEWDDEDLTPYHQINAAE